MNLAQRMAERLGLPCPRYVAYRGHTGDAPALVQSHVPGATGVPGGNEGRQGKAANAPLAGMREANRERFPGVAGLVDELRAAGFELKVLWASERGRELGQRQPFDGIDVDRLIALDDRVTRPVKVRYLPKRALRRAARSVDQE